MTAAAAPASDRPEVIGQTLTAPGRWHTVEIISDLHLHAGDLPTLRAWQAYLRHSRADAVIILGDLFEVWIGDDATASDSFLQQCTDSLRRASSTRAMYFMHGNRDFLVGRSFLHECAVGLLPDPCVLVFAGQRWLLSHGDALCLGDTQYMQFRAQVRSEAWQNMFLARPLDERRAVARDMRNRSESHKKAQLQWFDADTALSRDWLNAHGAACLVHGHTHQPADHDLGDQMQRMVLSDWDASATPARGEVLQISAAAHGGRANVLRLAPQQV